MTRKVIGLHGLPGSGKDTVADYLVAHYGFEKIAFADALKREVAEAFNVDTRLFHVRVLKERESQQLRLFACSDGDFIDWFTNYYTKASPSQVHYECMMSRSPRWLMQQWGDWRRGQNANYFIDKVRERIAALPQGRPVVITDIRFMNEAACASGYTCAEVWGIVKPDVGGADGHASNTPLPAVAITHHIDNAGTIEQLYDAVCDLLP